MPDEILTLPEVAQLLKVAEKTIYTMALRRSLPTFKVGGQWRFRREDLDKWIDGQKLSHRDSIRFSTFVQDQDAGGLEVR
jgi:excisionase family DNA binding protein